MHPKLPTLDKLLPVAQICRRSEIRFGAGYGLPRNKDLVQRSQAKFVRKSPHGLRARSGGIGNRRGEILLAMACGNGLAYCEPQS